MKKENVIDLAEYRAKLASRNQESKRQAVAGKLVISEELKSAIECLIIKLRAHEPLK